MQFWIPDIKFKVTGIRWRILQLPFSPYVRVCNYMYSKKIRELERVGGRGEMENGRVSNTSVKVDMMVWEDFAEVLDQQVLIYAHMAG